MVFVNSMSDLFHQDVPDDYIREVVRVMLLADWHTYQVLTKRSERMRELLQTRLRRRGRGAADLVGRERREPPRRPAADRRPAARRRRGLRFLSIEPLLEDLGPLDLSGIHWVIVGGESGPGARPMDREWVAVDPRPVPGGRRAVLLQAVGRDSQGEGRPAARRPDPR